MRLLMLTGSLPYPPASGGALRAYGLLQGLHAAGHRVTLLTLHDGRVSPSDTPLAALCERIITVPMPTRSRAERLRTLLLTREPDIAWRLYSEALADELRALLAEQVYDVIQFEAIEVGYYLPLARALQPAARLVFDTFNAEYLLQRAVFNVDRGQVRRWPAAAYSWLQSRRIARYEALLCRLADAVIAVSPEDAAALRGFRPDGQIHLVPSGIFVDAYPPTPPADLGSHALVFTGKMDYRPNVDAVLWFTEAILPLVQRVMPGARLIVVGQQPHARLATLRDHPAVTLTGWVDSVTPYLYGAAVYVAPLRMGSGTRLKLLEAMACGRAIVATTLAAAGMVTDARAAMQIADDAESFAAAVVALLHDEAQRAALGAAAQAQVRAHYDWPVLTPRLLAVYTTLGVTDQARDHVQP